MDTNTRFSQDDFTETLTRDDAADMLKGVRDEVKAMLVQFETGFALRAGNALSERLAKESAALESRLSAALDAKVAALEDSRMRALEKLEGMIAALPEPQIIVNVPQQPPPVVNVAAPVVNVPEQRPPVVNVEVPFRKSKKTIEYDAEGKPTCIIEEG